MSGDKLPPEKMPPEKVPEKKTDRKTTDPSVHPQQAAPKVAFFTSGVTGTEPTIVAELVSRLGESLRELYEERAGILEFDAGMTRDHAECLALLNIYRDHPLEVLGVTLLRRDSGECLLVTDPSIVAAREGLDGYREGLVDQAIAKFGGIVRLVPFRR